MTVTDHRTHEAHDHRHGQGCGHAAITHDDHTDDLHDGHVHAEHDDHYDEHESLPPRRSGPLAWAGPS